MKVYRIWILTVFALFLLCSPYITLSQEDRVQLSSNFITNGSFEEGDTSIHGWSGNGERISHNNAYHGEYIVRLDAGEYIRQELSVDSNQVRSFFFIYQSSDVIEVEYGYTPGTYDLITLDPASEWTQSINLPVNDNSRIDYLMINSSSDDTLIDFVVMDDLDVEYTLTGISSNSANVPTTGDDTIESPSLEPTPQPSWLIVSFVVLLSIYFFNKYLEMNYQESSDIDTEN